MDELLVEFKLESEEILTELLDLLEDLEEDPSQVKRLEDYGQKVGRIMGGAVSLAARGEEKVLLEQIGACAGVCKSVGYRGSQIGDRAAFAVAVIGLLLDMTETLQTMVEKVGGEQKFDLQDPVFLTILDRLEWVSGQFGKDLRTTLDIHTPPKEANFDIDEFLQRLGVNTKAQ